MKTEFNTIQVEVKDGVAVFSMNNPPVNQLSKHFVEDLAQALTAAYEDDDIKALVLTGTGRNFIAGADITQIQGVKDRGVVVERTLTFTNFVSSLETGPKPIVAAINGNCLGGGLEVAMACHYRVAAKGVNLGQPEVQIGLIPGAGGTQRLPRLIGLRYALEMITIGKPIKSEIAHKRGLVDAVTDADGLIEKAVEDWFATNAHLLDTRENKQNRLHLVSSYDKPDIDVISTNDAVEIIRWYQFQINIKLKRAVESASEEERSNSTDHPKDSDGSAKVALIGIDRSFSAWNVLLNQFTGDQPNSDDMTILVLHKRKD